MRQHQWIPASSDFTEWKCEYCGYEMCCAGPPRHDMQIFYEDPETKEEIPISCEDVEAGIQKVAAVHDA